MILLQSDRNTRGWPDRLISVRRTTRDLVASGRQNTIGGSITSSQANYIKVDAKAQARRLTFSLFVDAPLSESFKFKTYLALEKSETDHLLSSKSNATRLLRSIAEATTTVAGEDQRR